MGAAQDLVNAGFYGYQGWDDAGAAANFAQTQGAGKGGGNGVGGGGGGGPAGFPQLTLPDMTKLREQAYNATQAYYQKLAEEAKGDFDTAVKMMTADYSQGVRQAKEKNAYEVKYGTGELNDALASLGVAFGKENESLVDTLNKRGMAVYENNPDGTPNVVTPSEFKPTTDTTNFTYGSNLNNQNPTANLGRGGQELGQLQKDQSLRAQAEMRAKMQPLEQSAINLKQYTNPNSGFNPSDPGNSTKGTDLSQLGSSELGLVKGNTSALQNYRNTTENLANQRSQQINQIAGQAASLGQKSLDTGYTNQIQKELTNSFIQGGQG